MSKRIVSASAQALPKYRNRPSPPPVLHVYDRRKIMARSWQIARETREDAARKAYDASMQVIAGRIIPTKSVEMFLAEIPLDLSAALKAAWAEAKGMTSSVTPHSGALIVMRPVGALAPLRRRIRLNHIAPLLLTAARFLRNVLTRRAA